MTWNSKEPTSRSHSIPVHSFQNYSLLHLECHFFFLKYWFSSFLGLFPPILLERNQCDWDCSLRSNNNRIAICCTCIIKYSQMQYAITSTCLSTIWLLPNCNMTPSYMRFDFFLYVIWLFCSCATELLPICNMTPSYMQHDPFLYATWLLNIRDMTIFLSVTPFYMQHGSFIFVTWLLRVCDMTPSYQRHDSFIYMTWLLCMCNMTSWLQHDSFLYLTWPLPTGWRRLVGSLKLQILFHKRATKCRSLLRKMTYKDKGSYESSPPCICNVTTAYTWHDFFLCAT